MSNRIGEEQLVVVDRSMIEDIFLRDKTYHVILENYVIGILRGINET